MTLQFRQAYASRLRSEREKRGLGKCMTADMIGVSRVTYFKWEKGEVTPRLHQAYALWKLFGIDFSQMEHLLNLYAKIHDSKSI